MSDNSRSSVTFPIKLFLQVGGGEITDALNELINDVNAALGNANFQLNIPVMPSAATPLAGTELAVVSQGGVNSKVTISDLVTNQAKPMQLSKTVFGTVLNISASNNAASGGVNYSVGIGTHAVLPTYPNKSTWGIFSYIEDNCGGTSTTDEFVEAIHAKAVSSSGNPYAKIEGVVVECVDNDIANPARQQIGFETEMTNRGNITVPTSSFVSNYVTNGTLNIGYMSGTSDPAFGPVLSIDAHFSMNPTAGFSKSQAGYLACGDGLIYAAFVDVTTSNVSYGLSLESGFYSDVALQIKTFSPQIRLKKSGSPQRNSITGYTTSFQSWTLSLGNTTARSGANAGDDLDIARYDDTGVFLDFCFTIFRSTGQLRVNDFQSLAGLKCAIKTVATLPAASGALEGTRYGVSDALAPAALSPVVGGGAVHVPVYCNGTTWIVG